MQFSGKKLFVKFWRKITDFSSKKNPVRKHFWLGIKHNPLKAIYDRSLSIVIDLCIFLMCSYKKNKERWRKVTKIQDNGSNGHSSGSRKNIAPLKVNWSLSLAIEFCIYFCVFTITTLFLILYWISRETGKDPCYIDPANFVRNQERWREVKIPDKSWSFICLH